MNTDAEIALDRGAQGADLGSMNRSQHAFTFVEAAVVVAFVGLLAVVVVPRFAGAGQDTRVFDTADRLQQIAGAFDRFRASNGYWPPEIEAGQMPPEMRSAFRDFNPFAQPTPIGGLYDYDNHKDQPGVIIAIRPAPGYPAPSAANARSLDALLDDGDLRTGNFRAVGDAYAYAFSRK